METPIAETTEDLFKIWEGTLPRVKVSPVDDKPFTGTVIEEKEHLYVVRPDEDKDSIQNWSKKVCEIIK